VPNGTEPPARYGPAGAEGARRRGGRRGRGPARKGRREGRRRGRPDGRAGQQWRRGNWRPRRAARPWWWWRVGLVGAWRPLERGGAAGRKKNGRVHHGSSPRLGFEGSGVGAGARGVLGTPGKAARAGAGLWGGWRSVGLPFAWSAGGGQCAPVAGRVVMGRRQEDRAGLGNFRPGHNFTFF
jgi:hypothetical protein